MTSGWTRMLKKLLPRTLERIAGGRYSPGGPRRRDYGTKTVPDDYAQ
jgi:hypothetical protein